MSVYISIGRNVGTKPLSTAVWEEFISRVTKAATDFAGPLVSLTTGFGIYDGNREECAIVVTDGYPAAADLAALKVCLRNLARIFSQECIALTISSPEFIAP